MSNKKALRNLSNFSTSFLSLNTVLDSADKGEHAKSPALSPDSPSVATKWYPDSDDPDAASQPLSPTGVALKTFSFPMNKTDEQKERQKRFLIAAFPRPPKSLPTSPVPPKEKKFYIDTDTDTEKGTNTEKNFYDEAKTDTEKDTDTEQDGDIKTDEKEETVTREETDAERENRIKRERRKGICIVLQEDSEPGTPVPKQEHQDKAKNVNKAKNINRANVRNTATNINQQEQSPRPRATSYSLFPKPTRTNQQSNKPLPHVPGPASIRKQSASCGFDAEAVLRKFAQT
jgi:hypothetical protein